MESPPPAVFNDKAKRTQQGDLLTGWCLSTAPLLKILSTSRSGIFLHSYRGGVLKFFDIWRDHHTWSKSNNEGGYSVTMLRWVVRKKRITKCRPMSFSMNTAAGGIKMERTTNTLKPWNIFICMCEILGVHRTFWKPLSWRPENQLWEILECSILMI